MVLKLWKYVCTKTGEKIESFVLQSALQIFAQIRDYTELAERHKIHRLI